MLNLSVNTTLNTRDTLDRSYQYFVVEQGLQLVEWVAHLHAEQGACELRVTGGKIKGTTEVDSKAVLLSQVERLVKDTDPGEITFESQELDFPVKEFSDRLPKA